MAPSCTLQRYTRNPGQLLTDAQAVGSNKVLRSIATSVFSNGR